MNKIIIGVFVVILLYILYLYFFSNSSTMLVGMRDTASKVTISSSAITPGAGSLNFTFSIWVYVTEWSNSGGKYIFYRPNSDTSNALEMKFDSTINDVKISLDVGSSSPVTCSVESVPLQSWANIIMTLNGKALDLYLDGKLVRTCLLSAVPSWVQGLNTDLILPSSSGDEKSSFNGYTSNFKYLSKSINPREAYAIYREGFGSGNWLSGMFSKYRIKMSFLEDNVEVNSFEM
jgi:hypothetical protein|tara:strand:- start:1436 stop:2134 length:699 start_codon:yes stop_codon:yes gene_type:complete